MPVRGSALPSDGQQRSDERACASFASQWKDDDVVMRPLSPWRSARPRVSSYSSLSSSRVLGARRESCDYGKTILVSCCATSCQRPSRFTYTEVARSAPAMF